MKKSFLLLALLAVQACQQPAKNQLLLFNEQEEGVDPYQTRIIVTPEFVRFDDGDSSKSFLLYDRKNRQALNVNHNARTIMLVKYKDVSIQPPFELKHEDIRVDDVQDAPAIHGIKPKHHQLKTNGQVCMDVISIEGLMPQAVAALNEFQRLLASDSAVTFNSIPADMHEPCAMAMSTFEPARYLTYGFPIHQWRPGYSRSLVDFKEDYQADPALFELPKDYFRYTVQAFREGRVDLENRKIIEPDDAKGVISAAGKASN